MKPIRTKPCPVCGGRGTLHVRRDEQSKSHRRDMLVFEPRARWEESCPVCLPSKLAGHLLGSSMPRRKCFNYWNARFRANKTRRPNWTPAFHVFPVGKEFRVTWYDESELWQRLFLGEPWVRLVKPGIRSEASVWFVTCDDLPWRPTGPRVWNTRCLKWFHENEMPTPQGASNLSGQLVMIDDLPVDLALPYTREEILFLASGLPTVFSNPSAMYARTVNRSKHQFWLRYHYDEGCDES